MHVIQKYSVCRLKLLILFSLTFPFPFTTMTISSQEGLKLKFFTGQFHILSPNALHIVNSLCVCVLGTLYRGRDYRRCKYCTMYILYSTSMHYFDYVVFVSALES